MDNGPAAGSNGITHVDSFSPSGRRIPAWLMSAALHFVLFTALGFALRVTPRGAPVEPNREGGIVLVHDVAGKLEYFQETQSDSQGDAEQGQIPQSTGVSELPPGEAPAELTQGLPALPSPDGQLGGGATSVADVRGFTAATGARPSIQGEIETSVFGVTGKGSKFVYVFDRSGSMQGYQGRPLAAAKKELNNSLKSLSSVQQFQLIFYNERTHVFNPYFPEKPRLLFGDEATLRQADNFVKRVTADGGTRHMRALRLALGMSPDVVFFLTDAAEPQLSAAELDEVRRINRGQAVINSIEFGTGSFPGGRNFLMRLADQNRGQHVYVDVTRLPIPK